jgi:tetratricopeptide (TPR) repeat protein
MLGAAAALTQAQTHPPTSAAPAEGIGYAVLQGYVHDSTGEPAANAVVVLKPVAGTDTATTLTLTTHTDLRGAYRFAALPAGAYAVRAETAHGAATVDPVNLQEEETKTLELALVPSKSATDGTAAAPEFYDEPQFTVAGVTSATNSGGHGSDTVLRTTEALARATVSLSKESAASSTMQPSGATEDSLRDALARDPQNLAASRQLGKWLVGNGKAAQALPYLEPALRAAPGDPELHHLLGDVQEKLGNPLEAVREYQRAAELEPSEPNLFDWGSELLAHRAPEPATEVFAKGNRLFPTSVRMLVALGVAWYARGSYDQASLYLVRASDLDPGNPTPYLFLGRMQTVEPTPSSGSVERLARFAQTRPNDALANYYYAVSLWKQSAQGQDQGQDHDRSERVESLLRKAIDLDPKLGGAYLQLGIIYAQRADFPRAVGAFQKAIEASPDPSETLQEAHYRLAQAYGRVGEQAKAKEQLQLHAEITKKLKDDSDRNNSEARQFVISLQGASSATRPQP